MTNMASTWLMRLRFILESWNIVRKHTTLVCDIQQPWPALLFACKLYRANRKASAASACLWLASYGIHEYSVKSWRKRCWNRDLVL